MPLEHHTLAHKEIQNLDSIEVDFDTDIDDEFDDKTMNKYIHKVDRNINESDRLRKCT